MKRNKAKPFLKWAGGKSQLLQQFENYYPNDLISGKINKYIEPFIGGGAVFFDIVQRFNIDFSYISDVNKDLIIAYKTIQKTPEELINLLEEYQKENLEKNPEERKEFFLETRKKYNFERSEINYDLFSNKSIERTAKLIFLNRTCFNGLFRMNSKGEFNVPFGDYKNPRIVDGDNIKLISSLLKNTKIKNANYDECFNYVDNKTFVYFDPPYRPISKTSNFTTYAGFEFKEEEQIKLYDFFHKLDKDKHAKLMLSNSDPKNENKDDDFFDHLYKKFKVNRVFANRMINSNSEKRGKVTEVLITNYDEPKETEESKIEQLELVY